MYHSIAEGDGPTRIDPRRFSDQMAALADAGYAVARLSDVTAWASGIRDLPGRTAVITFDDAFANFATHAAPILLERGWPATVFAPTGWIGRRAGWSGGGDVPLLAWDAMRDLARAGFEFGSHTVSHRNLTELAGDELGCELTDSRARLEDELGAPVGSFAAPYGAANASVRAAIARHYRLAAGARLGRAGRDCDAYDLPRIEMHYFRDLGLWRQFLAGRGAAYLAVRQLGRKLRAEADRLRRRLHRGAIPGRSPQRSW